MLMMTPEFRKQIRAALASHAALRPAPVTLPQIAGKKRKAAGRKLTQTHRHKLVSQTAAIMRCGEPTYFAFEGFMRHGLRSGLCLRGWDWQAAETMAADIVATALNQIGAKRPTPKEGQPEYMQEGVIMIERERCMRCGWALPEGHWKFCSKRCLAAHHSAKHRRFEAMAVEALHGAP